MEHWAYVEITTKSLYDVPSTFDILLGSEHQGLG